MPNWKKMIAAGALVLAMAGPVLADSNGWWEHRSGLGMDRMMGGWGAGGPMMGYHGGDYMLDRIDGRLAFLETELKISEEQVPAWKELSDVIRATAETHNDAMETMIETVHDDDFWTRPLPERLAFQQAHMEARLEEIKATSQAVEKFYAILNADQQKVADEIVLRPWAWA
ncbi:Spy/CpxP family protein refolding chaperone [Chelativorans intermedius]|uniref:Spy/CpxP family protein refolding chaperone n=1 Tax=Chelativorans intermedius TaxID=515947 RepID=A0ABV6D802_9HYPH|nr:Spy/CpxP family protein refolding chaperone [Chelativorans intermedius]MCT8999925.1 Spy/CpxP family protein refolding chaperone [Chelativorans intermedius]